MKYTYNDLDLQLATEKGDLSAVMMLLEQRPIDVNTPDAYGRTPMDTARMYSYHDLEAFLRSKGGQETLHDEDARFPLHWATHKSYRPVIDILLAKGANVNQRNVDDMVPLHTACYADSLEIVQLLLDKGADPLLVDRNGFLPLQEACMGAQNMDIIRLLFERGSDPNQGDIFHGTHFHWAAKSGNVGVIDLFLENGARPSLNSTDDLGYTPLHYAVSWQKLDAVKHLMQKGARTDLLDNKGRTPLQLARELFPDAVSILEDAD